MESSSEGIAFPKPVTKEKPENDVLGYKSSPMVVNGSEYGDIQVPPFFF